MDLNPLLTGSGLFILFGAGLLIAGIRMKIREDLKKTPKIALMAVGGMCLAIGIAIIINFLMNYE
jgi:hypothetical protein